MVQSELEEVVAALEEERAMDQSSYADCFRFSRNKIALRTFTGIALQMWQQLTGINFISYCAHMAISCLSSSTSLSRLSS